MAAATFTQALASSSLASGRVQRRGAAAGGRRLTARTYATQTEEPPRLSFGSNERANLGYLEEDSAGQKNIFAVEPRTYVQNSSRDPGTASNTGAIAGGAAAAAVALIAIGLLAVMGRAPAPTVAEVADTSYGSLTSYVEKFSQKAVRAPVADAPALTEQSEQ